MLSESSGTLPDGTPFRIWVSRDPVPGRTVDHAVIAVDGTILLASPVATVHNSRVLREVGRAIVAATDWTREQQQAHQDAAQERYDRACEATREA